MTKKIIKTDAGTVATTSVPVINTETNSEQVLTPIQESATEENQDPAENAETGSETSLDNETDVIQEENQDPVEKTDTGSETSLDNETDVTKEENQDPEKNDEVEEVSDLRSKMQPYFDHNPGVDILFFASDNCPFYSKPDAESYQKNLDPAQNVKPIKR